MIPIRPYQLFALVDRPPSDRAVLVQMPHRRGFGGLTLLESFVAIAVIQTIKARRIFEIGTFLGGTTLNFANNLPNDGEVLTLDLTDSIELRDQDPFDAEVSGLHFLEKALDFLGSPVQAKIRQLKGDSTTFDFSPWRGAVDLVFVDGGHDLRTVRADTLNAFDLIDGSSPGAILWHDYQNPSYPDLTEFLDQLSEQKSIFHAGDTMLCIWFNEAAIHLSNQLIGSTPQSGSC